MKLNPHRPLFWQPCQFPFLHRPRISIVSRSGYQAWSGSEVDVSVASTRIDGIVQVTAGTEVFFMTDDGQFFIQGRLSILDTQDDLTELGKRGIRRSLLENFDTSTLITLRPDQSGP